MTPLSTPNWVRWWFRGAAVYGVVALLAALLTPSPVGVLYFYGFVGTALAFQLVFWIIGGDPVRYRALMPAAVCEKLAFVVPGSVLVARGLLGGTLVGLVGAIAIDLVLGVGFAIAWRLTPRA